MARITNQQTSEGTQQRGTLARGLAGLHAVARFPFRVVAISLKRIAQVLLSLIIVVLHPRFRWLRRLLTRSALVRNYIGPAMQQFVVNYYTPYFRFLRRLPPYWATLSIAVPLAALEPAKLYATILIARHPKAGVLLWLFLQGLSLVLIDRTWVAVRPQSRKIWLVSRLHAWGSLNVSYGKYWVTSSAPYQRLIRLLERARSVAQAFWWQLSGRRPRRRSR